MRSGQPLWLLFLFFLSNPLLLTSSSVSADWNPDSSEFDFSGLDSDNLWSDDNFELDSQADLFDDSEPDISSFSLSDADTSNLNDLSSDFAMTTDTFYDCPFYPLPPTRMHIRENSCTDLDTLPRPDIQQRPEVKTSDQVEEYWCSTSRKVGFGNIPVCDRSPKSLAPIVRPSELELDAHVIPPPSSPPSGFQNLGLCSLRKFMHQTLGDRCVQTLEFLSTKLTVSFPVTPGNAFDCPADQVWCCNAWLPEEWEYWSPDPVRSIHLFYKI